MQYSPHNAPDTRNLMIALFLCSTLLLGWHYLYNKPRHEAMQAQAELVQQKKEQRELLPAQSVEALAGSDVISTERVTISTKRLHGSIALTGARFDDLTLANYHETVDRESPEVVLLSSKTKAETYFARFGWLATDKTVRVPDDRSVWEASSEALGVGTPLILNWNNGQGVTFTLTVSVDERYLFTIAQHVSNQSGKELTFVPYAFINRAYEAHGPSFFILHEGPLGVFEGTLKEIDYDSLREDGAQEFTDNSGWLGITDKYWLTALIPEQGRPMTGTFKHYMDKAGFARYQADYLGASEVVSPGGELSNTVRFFAGAKELAVLDDYTETYQLPLFDRAVDFGYLYFLTKPIFLMLTYFYDLIGNFGLAILLLTVLIKLLLFPLANKSYVAMSAMKKLQPKMVELRERYGDDKTRMNQELMGLYKKEKVNPAAGCLPLLLQIPVFFALYKVLFVSIEMRHAPFYLWIHDLSAPDPTTIFNLFGLLSWNPPSFLMIGVLPIVMSITMIIQQKLQPAPSDPTQAKVMAWLPYIFLFLFAGFPAGLVLYWAWNNTLSIIQQWVIMKRYNAKQPKQT